MFTFIAIVAGAAILTAGVVAVAYTATEIKNDLDAANSAIADLEASTDIVTSNVRKKVKLTSDGEKIIGLKDGSLVKAQSTLTTVDFDTTEYGDRAVLQLRNDTGSSITLTGLSIRGKPVKQLSGANGYVWEYSDYDDIEKNGENFVEVSNDFIFSPFQAKSIGDFVWKELRPHKMYSLTLIGTQYQYEIGQIWHLTLSYSLDGHTMEDIDTDVEVMGISLSRSVGGVGTTALNLRVPSAAWELTLAKNAKLVGAGNSQRLSNRSNTVTVASSTWTGQADYFCDGMADNVEIQAAIDYLDSLGGGTLLLTSGQYNLDEYGDTSYIGNAGGKYSVIVKSNIKIIGSGSNTIVYYNNTKTYSFCFICLDFSVGVQFSDFYALLNDSIRWNFFIWCSRSYSTYVTNIESNKRFLLNSYTSSDASDPLGMCFVNNVSCWAIAGGKLNISSSSFSGNIISDSTISACTCDDITISGANNSVASCIINTATLTSASSNSAITGCSVTGLITNTGTGNVVANNA